MTIERTRELEQKEKEEIKRTILASKEHIEEIMDELFEPKQDSRTFIPALCKTTQAKTIAKGWGINGIGETFVYHKPNENPHQQIQADTVKLLHIAKDKRLSRHMHKDKSEYFFAAFGSFRVEFWSKDGKHTEITLKKGERVFVPAMMQHRMTGLEDENILVEVSTLDTPEDNWRIEKGD